MTQVAVKARGIPFSTDMVKAILEGRKTQTRRVIKPQLEDYRDGYPDGYDSPPHCMVKYKGKWIDDGDFVSEYCPYGQAGDRLWVKESWARLLYEPKDIEVTVYKAGWNSETQPKWKSPRFMFKKYARIWLEITEVRAERLQDITLEDCKAEGIEPLGAFSEINNYRFAFIDYWVYLNTKRGYGWEVNPWVWVIEFKLI